MLRRDWLRNISTGLSGLALHSLLSSSAGAAVPGGGAGGPLVPMEALTGRAGHFPARAQRIIFLFMHGGPSHVDTFDYKPGLAQRDGQPLPFAKPRVQFSQTGNLLKSPWKFRQYGTVGRGSVICFRR